MTTAEQLAEAVATTLGTRVRAVDPVSGGDVAQSYRLDLSDGVRVFAKTHPNAPRGFFSAEAIGLGWLRGAGGVPVPEVLAVSDGDTVSGSPNLLVLEWIEQETVPADAVQLTGSEAEFGRGLAALHRSTATRSTTASGGATGTEDLPTQVFGRPDRASTGSRGLPNDPCETWAEFYATQRLLPLAALAHDGAHLPSSASEQLYTLAGRLDDLGFPCEQPSLLHGDLWAGNRLVDAGGRSWLIDPAAHFGAREFDLAMMRLFGGFGRECFDSYDEVLPLADGWGDRVSLHQIAPLVVHAIKFGGGYVQAASEAIARYA